MDMTRTAPSVLTPEHPDFPIEVRSMSRPPSKVFLLGPLPHGRKIAIVGMRRATSAALCFSRSLAQTLCRAGWSVWSGGAAGIDAAAHEGSVEAGGKSVVVMGTGFDHLYPAENTGLFDRVLETGGAWLSLYPPEQVATRWSFLARNELLAAMVDHVVMVQAPIRSGARSTMAAARRMGRITWAVPGTPWDKVSEGCLLEIETGARALVYPEQLLGLARPSSHAQPAGPPTRQPTRQPKSQPTQHPAHQPVHLSPTHQTVVNVVTRGPVHLDTLCEETGLTVAAASEAVLALTLERVLLESADGRYFLNNFAQ